MSMYLCAAIQFFINYSNSYQHCCLNSSLNRQKMLKHIDLDELGEIAELPTGLGLMVLTTLEGEEAKIQARGLVDRSRDSRAIIDLVSTIIVYKFTNLSRDEVDVMLGVTLQQT